PSAPPALARALPGVPTNATAVAEGVGSIRVSWGVPDTNGSPILEYSVRSEPTRPVQTTAPGTTTTLFSGLSSGQSYTFYVRARTAAGWGPEASATATAVGAPSGPGGVTVARQAGNTYPFAVNVGWNRPSNAGGACIKAYRVEYSTNASTVSQSHTISSTPTPSCSNEPPRSDSFTGLAAGVEWRYFRVVAVNTADLEGASGWVSIRMTQVCTVTATEDSWVNEDDGGLFSSSKRNTNYGNNGRMDVDKNGSFSFVKFHPSSSTCQQYSGAVPASAVTVAGTVRLYNESTTSYSRDHSIYRVTSGWSEGSVTWNNQRPSTSGSYTDTINSSNGGYQDLTVSVADVNQERSGARNGWALKDRGGNIFSSWAGYTTSEGTSSRRPQLVITFY
ncbi:MAG: fibronectin type III domain-containing protein, partial [Microthrixaceae bacterium]|nr:fibronectin type III domain-containing protein [Microthrixaceae bacterium]